MILQHSIEDGRHFQVVSVDNRFLEQTSLGWRDVTLLLRVKVPSSGRYHIMEMQLQLRRLMDVRGTAHNFYEKMRSLLPDDVMHLIIDQLTTDTTLDLCIG